MASTRAVVQSVFESFVDDVKSNKRRFCLSSFVVALAKVLPRPCPPGSILLYGTWHGAGKLKAALQAETDDGAGDASAMLMDEGVCLQSVLRITRELVVVLTRRDTPGSSPFLRSCLELLNQLRRKLVVEFAGCEPDFWALVFALHNADKSAVVPLTALLASMVQKVGSVWSVPMLFCKQMVGSAFVGPMVEFWTSLLAHDEGIPMFASLCAACPLLCSVMTTATAFSSVLTRHPNQRTIWRLMFEHKDFASTFGENLLVQCPNLWVQFLQSIMIPGVSKGCMRVRTKAMVPFYLRVVRVFSSRWGWCVPFVDEVLHMLNGPDTWEEASVRVLADMVQTASSPCRNGWAVLARASSLLPWCQLKADLYRKHAKELFEAGHGHVWVCDRERADIMVWIGNDAATLGFSRAEVLEVQRAFFDVGIENPASLVMSEVQTAVGRHLHCGFERQYWDSFFQAYPQHCRNPGAAKVLVFVLRSLSRWDVSLTSFYLEQDYGWHEHSASLARIIIENGASLLRLYCRRVDLRPTVHDLARLCSALQHQMRSRYGKDLPLLLDPVVLPTLEAWWQWIIQTDPWYGLRSAWIRAVVSPKEEKIN